MIRGLMGIKKKVVKNHAKTLQKGSLRLPYVYLPHREMPALVSKLSDQIDNKFLVHPLE